MTAQVKSQWETYIKAKNTSQQTADKYIGSILKQNLGLNALHIVTFPGDLITPVGMPSDNCRQTSHNMQTSADVISKKERKHSKLA